MPFFKSVITFDHDAIEKCFSPILKDNWKDFAIKIYLAKKCQEIGRKTEYFNFEVEYLLLGDEFEKVTLVGVSWGIKLTFLRSSGHQTAVWEKMPP